MRYGHGSTNNSPKEQSRRKEQPALDEASREKKRRGAMGGDKTDELGIAQGQNGEQGGTANPRNAVESGKIRH